MPNFKLLPHVPYLVAIGVLLLLLLVLILYLLCSTGLRKRRQRNREVQTYFTCMPRKLTAAQQETHGLVNMSLTKGQRIDMKKKTHYTSDPTETTGSKHTGTGTHTGTESHTGTGTMDSGQQLLNDVWVKYTTQASQDSQASATLAPTRIAPALPVDTPLTSTINIPPSLPDKQNRRHDYENASAWLGNDGFRESAIVPVKSSTRDDDLVSVAFTNDSFETYDDEYINRDVLKAIHMQNQKRT